jgi:hypothetical protein
VERVLLRETGEPVDGGMVDVGKHLRPSYRAGRIVLYVEPGGEPGDWRAVKLT